MGYIQIASEKITMTFLYKIISFTGLRLEDSSYNEKMNNFTMSSSNMWH